MIELNLNIQKEKESLKVLQYLKRKRNCVIIRVVVNNQ